MPWNSIRTDRTSLALCLTTYLWMHSTAKAAQLKVGVSRAQRVVWVTWFTSPFHFIFVYNAPGRFTLHVHNIPGTLSFYYLFLILSLSRLPPTLPTFFLFSVELVCWTFVSHTYKVDFRRSNTHHVRFWQRNFITLSLSLPAYDCGRYLCPYALVAQGCMIRVEVSRVQFGDDDAWCFESSIGIYFQISF